MRLMTDASASDAIEFSVLIETSYGSEVRVVGTPGALGAWCPEAGLPLATSSEAYPKWSAKVPLPKAELTDPLFEYKFVVINPDGSATWEDGDNRRLVTIASSRKLPTPWFGEPTPPIEMEEICFEAMCVETEPGDAVVVVGCAEALGSWSAQEGVRLETSPGSFPWWYGETQLPANDLPFSWKLAILKADGSVMWEPVDNRTALPPHGDATRWCIRVHFGGASAAPVARPPAPQGPPKRFTRIGGIKTSDSLPELRLVVSSPSTTAPSVDSNVPAARVEEQLVVLCAEDVGLREAEEEGEAEVVAVFEADDSQRHPLRWDPERNGWTLSFGDTGLAPAVHTFYFLVGDERVLSSAHPVLLGASVNVAMLSEPLYRYLSATTVGPEATPEVEHEHEEEVPRASRLLVASKNCVQSRSHGGEQGMSMEEELAGWEASRERSIIFPPRILEGLYDAELRLWLLGHAVPAGLPPPSRLWAGARRLKKACSTVCEDACFFGDHALGVADGVGGMSSFASEGVDAAAYAMEILHHCSEWLEKNPPVQPEVGSMEAPEVRAVQAIRAAELAVESYGACTAVLAVMEGSTLGVANLGDSGFMVLRKRPNGMTIVEQSVDQQHGYNTPYQLMRLPNELVVRRRLTIRHIDTAADCETYRFGLRAGDLILLFSDGLRDNLHDREILHIVDRAMPPTLAALAGKPESATPPELVAKALAAAARVRSVDPLAQVPFVEYSKMHGQVVYGGKADDITVVAAWAMP